MARLDGCIALDEKGFVKTGFDLTRGDLAMRHWPLARQPFLLETSLPGVFAVGDVRSGSVKRVGAAIGEGAAVVQQLHEFRESQVEASRDRSAHASGASPRAAD